MTRHVFKAGEVMLAMSRLENDRKTLLESFIVIQTGTAQLFQRLPGSGALRRCSFTWEIWVRIISAMRHFIFPGK